MGHRGDTGWTKARRSLAALVFGYVGLLVCPAAAVAEDQPVDGAVGPGQLVLFSVQFVYGPNGCIDPVPSVVAQGWYEDAEGNRAPGPAFAPLIHYGRTSADVGFHVQADATTGSVVVDTAVLYDCADGSVLRIQERLYRWTIELPSTHLPPGRALGTIGILGLASGAFYHGQRRPPCLNTAGSTADACS
jgi:hypothetical protein